MFGAAEQDIQLQPTPIWVHLTYQTALIDNTGKLQIRRDVYNLDSRTLAAIKSERGAVEPGEERKRVSGAGVAKCPSEDFLIPLNHLDSMEPILIRGVAYIVDGQEPGEVRPRSLEISERPD
jgi:hypothetical protein